MLAGLASFSGTRAGLCSFGCKFGGFPCDLIQLGLPASSIFLRLRELMKCGDAGFFGFDVSAGQALQIRFSALLIFLQALELCLRASEKMFEACDFGFIHAEFALQCERSGLSGAAASDHTAMKARAVESDEILLRVFARQPFGLGGRLDEVSGLELRKKLFCGRTERFAEINEIIEARNEAGTGNRGAGGFWFVLQMAERIDEKRSATAHLFAKQGDAGASVIKGFDDDVFEFVTEKLFDRAFVLLLHFGVIGEHAHGTKALGFVACAC